MNDFKTDLVYSLEERENEVFDSLYYRIFPRLKLIEFVEDIEIQKKGIDKILHFDNDAIITIDEKKRRHDYGDIILELYANFKQKRPGWLFICQCDYIVYAVIPTKKVYLLPSLLLKQCWHNNRHEWKAMYPLISANNPGYTTVNIAIPTDVLLDALAKEMKQELLHAKGNSS